MDLSLVCMMNTLQELCMQPDKPMLSSEIVESEENRVSSKRIICQLERQAQPSGHWHKGPKLRVCPGGLRERMLQIEGSASAKIPRQDQVCHVGMSEHLELSRESWREWWELASSQVMHGLVEHCGGPRGHWRLLVELTEAEVMNITLNVVWGTDYWETKYTLGTSVRKLVQGHEIQRCRWEWKGKGC